MPYKKKKMGTTVEITRIKEQINSESTVASVINRVPYWSVEEVRGVRISPTGDGLEYLVRWVGYAEAHNSWEPEKNCRLAARKIKDFYSRMPKEECDFFQQMKLQWSKRKRTAKVFGKRKRGRATRK